QPVVDGQRQGERVALLWVEEQSHDDAIGPLVACFPAEPAGQAMNRVSPVGLGQRGPMGDVRERVATVMESVRSWEGWGPPGCRVCSPQGGLWAAAETPVGETGTPATFSTRWHLSDSRGQLASGLPPRSTLPSITPATSPGRTHPFHSPHTTGPLGGHRRCGTP